MTKKWLNILCSIAVLITGVLSAQENAAQKPSETATDTIQKQIGKELADVTIADLEQRRHPLDTSAVAAVLYTRGRVGFGFSFNGPICITRVKTRIKIYKKEGYPWANKSISYVSNKNIFEYVGFTRAVTYNLVNGQIVKTKLGTNGEFDERLDSNYGQKGIVLPNVSEGSIVEYEYVVKTPIIQFIRDWEFQNYIPVDYNEYVTTLPESVSYNVIQRGFVDIKKNSVLYKGTAENELETIYVAENMPTIDEEPYVDNVKNYIVGIRHEVSSVTLPGKKTVHFATDWKAVAHTIYKSPDFSDELKKTNYFENDIDPLIQGLSDKEKINVIFDFVKSRMNWNMSESYYCDEGVKKAYKTRTGNSAEINLMLTAMLRYAKLEASPILLSTTEHGIAIYPSIYAYNYVIAGVTLNNETILLDATEKLAMPNILPERALNWSGRLIRKDETSEDILLTATMSRENVNVMVSIDDKVEINGKFKRYLSGHDALLCRLEHNNPSVNRIENVENEFKVTDVADYLLENEKNLNEPVIQSFSFTDIHSAEVIGDKMYISPMLFFTIKANPFMQEKRQFPINFRYPKEIRFMIILELPEGYSVESLPANGNIQTEGDICSFKYTIGKSDKKIQVSGALKHNVANVAIEGYPLLKDFFRRMIEKQNEKIVLKKR